MTSSPPPAEIGRRVGSYILYDTIARGGMADVRLGRVMASGGFAKIVAVKQLRAERTQDPEFAAMLVDEARLASRIRHPNVVSVLDVVDCGSELLVVMEYIEGESLAQLLWSPADEARRPTVEIVAAIVRDVLLGLHAAHDAVDEHARPLGIVHRDVSPENILVGRDGVARIADFGVAKAAGRLQQTREGSVKGKVAYMAPEHARGGEVTRHSDVYACGVVLWEALVGERLFADVSGAGLFLRVLNEVVPPPSSRAPHLPEALDRLVLDALARDPEERYESAKDFATALSEVVDIASPWQVAAWVEAAAGPALAAREERLAACERLPAVPPPDDSVPFPRSSSHRRTGTLAAAAVLFGMICLVGFVAALVRSPSRAGASVASPPARLPPAADGGGEGPAAAADPDDSAPAGPVEDATPRPHLPPPRAAAGARGCDPPYDVDSAGRRHFRVECVRGR